MHNIIYIYICVWIEIHSRRTDHGVGKIREDSIFLQVSDEKPALYLT